MLNVLFVTEDTSQFINRIYYDLEQELKERANVMIWRKSGHIDFILSQLPTKPDFVLLLNDIDQQMSPIIKGLSHSGIPTGLFINDAHRFINLRRNFITKNNINHLFTVIRDKFIQIYPEFVYKMEWFPHFVQTEMFRDYGIDKDINLLMMGAISDHYPLRQKIIKTYKGDPDFVYHKHPGYRNFNKDEKNQHFIGERYAREINRAKIVFTCPSVFQYPVIKYFEVLACKTLLLAPTFKELEDLGFVPDHHFIPIDENNFMDKAAYYLANETERQTIAEQGYQFIRKRHSVEQRADQLIKKIESVIQK
ncbi:glycosyltransferase [Virgibacillus dakarensis]|nr:glycosyltransferase [Virgibacillus dakarensis]